MPQTNGLRYDHLNYDEIISVHEQIINAGGGCHGMVSPANLEHIVNHIREYTYKGNHEEQVMAKAAYLLHGIITTHAFIDGHKRTALIVTRVFLEVNGLRIDVGEEEVIAFLKEVAEYKHDIKSVKRWLQKKAKTVSTY